MKKAVSPNIEIFNDKVRALGVEIDDPRLSERQLFKAYTEGLEPTLEMLIPASVGHDSDDNMDVSLQIG